MKPFCPRKSQYFRVPSLVWMMIGLPKGAMGVASKLKGPLKCSQAEMTGAMLDWRRRFRVISVCGRSVSHRKLENVLDSPARMDRNGPWRSGSCIWLHCGCACQG